MSQTLELEGIAKTIFEQRYAYPGETTWQERAKVIAKTIASAESPDKVELTEQKFYESLRKGDFVPGGRIIYGSGRREQNLLNCFSSDTLVFTKTGYKKIKDIEVGEEVLTHKGRFRKVINKFSQGKRKELLSIMTYNLNDSLALKITADHKIMTPYGLVEAEKLKEGDFVCLGEFNESFKLESIKVSNYISKKLYTVEGAVVGKKCKMAGALRYSDGQAYEIPEWFGKPIINDIKINEEFALWIGYYLSEGCAPAHKNGIKFTFHVDETNYVKDVLDLGYRIFGIKGKAVNSKAGKWVDVIFNSKILNEFHKNYLGDKFNKKILPWTLVGSPSKIKKQILVGLIRGDGSIYKHKTCASMSLRLANPTLVYQAYLMAKSLGYDCSYKYNPRVRKETHSPTAELHCRTAQNNYDLYNLVTGEQVFNTNHTQIKKIEKVQYDDLVWDISVEEDHTLVANGIVASNCYALEPQDNVLSIGKLLQDVYRISCGGGGIGFNFSALRPKGDAVKSIPFSAPGSVSVMQMINEVGNHVRAGAARRTALISILNVTHPDLLDFLHIKLDKKELNNFNISVAITDRFIEAVEQEEEWYFTFNNRRYDCYDVRRVDNIGHSEILRIPALNEEDALGRASAYYRISFEDVFDVIGINNYTAKEIWDTIIENSLECGDPGIYQIDFANKHTNVSYFEFLAQTNPCGEISMPSFANCCLGHINLSNMVLQDGSDIDWKLLAKTIKIGIRFLDNVLTINHFPIEECKTTGNVSRRIGLGFTGLHYMLIKLGLRYGSEKSLEFCERLAATIRNEAYKASVLLAKEKGVFPSFDRDKFLNEGFAKTLPPRIRHDIKKYGIRNAVMLTVAPTGTISMVLGTSTGVEPIFSAMYRRRYRKDNVWAEEIVVDPLFKSYYENDPQDPRLDLFVGAYDVSPEEHIKMQACWQQFVDQCISKTLNLPKGYTSDELSDLVLTYAKDLKGFTIYRAGSKGNEPLEAIPLSEENIKTYMPQVVSEEQMVGTACSLDGTGDCG